ncbi:MAG: succinyl-diaminopimelate desuccinylase [Burkholderiaceae bacterium]
MTADPVLDLTRQLIALRSVTPDDAGCLPLIVSRLEKLGFKCELMPFGDTLNLWACLTGDEAGPVLTLAGHTDVVPTGPLDKWHTDPFEPTEKEGLLYGRGAADMKGSLAAFVVACEEFVARRSPKGSLALLLTSDEEGPATDGTTRVVETLRARGQRLDYCIVGEPTSSAQLGDTIKNGRRGSLSGKLTVKGIQGHIAYPHLARNPVHELAPALTELAGTVWDEGNAFFPATTWQVSNIHAGTGASNIIPGDVVVDFNFRFSTENTADSLKSRVTEILNRHELEFDLTWRLSGNPFLTEPGALSNALQAAVKEVTGTDAELSTTGGTSDGRFIATLCEQVVEFGPCNASIHKVNEHVRIADLMPLKAVYRQTMERLL